eukprot:1066072-Rhodomonas_salina.3
MAEETRTPGRKYRDVAIANALMELATKEPPVVELTRSSAGGGIPLEWVPVTEEWIEAIKVLSWPQFTSALNDSVNGAAAPGKHALKENVRQFFTDHGILPIECKPGSGRKVWTSSRWQYDAAAFARRNKRLTEQNEKQAERRNGKVPKRCSDTQELPSPTPCTKRRCCGGKSSSANALRSAVESQADASQVCRPSQVPTPQLGTDLAQPSELGSCGHVNGIDISLLGDLPDYVRAKTGYSWGQELLFCV